MAVLVIIALAIASRDRFGQARPMYCRECGELIPDPGTPGRCTRCGCAYDRWGNFVDEPPIPLEEAAAALEKFRPPEGKPTAEIHKPPDGCQEERRA
jgi:hypothetical protein